MNSRISLLFLMSLLACGGCNVEVQSEPITDRAPESHDHDHEHEDHDGHEGEKTFRSTVEELVKLSEQIREGFENGDSGADHGPLHRVGHVLEDISTLAGNENFSKEQYQAIQEAKEQLFKAYGNIDKRMHGDGSEGSTFEQEADRIQSATKVITEAAGLEL